MLSQVPTYVQGHQKASGWLKVEHVVSSFQLMEGLLFEPRQLAKHSSSVISLILTVILTVLQVAIGVENKWGLRWWNWVPWTWSNLSVFRKGEEAISSELVLSLWIMQYLHFLLSRLNAIILTYSIKLSWRDIPFPCCHFYCTISTSLNNKSILLLRRISFNSILVKTKNIFSMAYTGLVERMRNFMT